MAEKRVCRDFIKDPKTNPLDGRRLVPGKGPYFGYISMCTENGFDVDYMLDENFINELSSKPKRSTSPSRSPRNISIPRSPKSTSLRSQPVLPRSIPSSIRSDNVPMRSVSVLTPQSTQTVYPRVVAPSASVTQSTSVVRAPVPLYTQRSEQIGREMFDPDPVTTVTKIPGRVVRETVRGPYGPSGENVLVSGTHKLPGQVVYSTADIPEHEVRSVHNGYNQSVVNNQSVKKVSYPQPVYKARSEQIGNETFDPDPITTVTETPSSSVRTAVRGPYGPNGETVTTTGVYTAPGRRVYSTADIPEHEVRSVPVQRPVRNTYF